MLIFGLDNLDLKANKRFRTKYVLQAVWSRLPSYAGLARLARPCNS